MSDLIGLTASLVDIPSVSHDEKRITDFLESLLDPVPWLETVRVGNNLVSRTNLGRPQRLLLAGHTDTVPPNGNEKAVIDGDVVWGVGSVDMKAGLAVMVDLATTVAEPAVDVTYIFYQCEELAGSADNGMEQLFLQRRDLLGAHAVVLTEPTGGCVEAGCQGILTMEAGVEGLAAHTARGWLGRNAIHRLRPLLARLEEYQNRHVVIDGCEYIEGMQAVHVSGGRSHNVVPDKATLIVNHRFAPDRTFGAAEAQIREVLGEVDYLHLVDRLPAAPPALLHPLFTRLLDITGEPPRAKLGWTDVARFAAHGFPATNFGPGDPAFAHKPDERVTRGELEDASRVLRTLIEEGAPVPGL
ncbi:MAG: succinyl-diaminopimelate desuccinylase [Actinomycetota bacterium]|nr:succinyl-diaminopimelate desuccinylase [Actinomycetota bacterium]